MINENHNFVFDSLSESLVDNFPKLISDFFRIESGVALSFRMSQSPLPDPQLRPISRANFIDEALFIREFRREKFFFDCSNLARK